MSRIAMSPDERQSIEALATRLGVNIPGTTSAAAWPLIVLEAIVDRIERLEKAASPPQSSG